MCNRWLPGFAQTFFSKCAGTLFDKVRCVTARCQDSHKHGGVTPTSTSIMGPPLVRPTGGSYACSQFVAAAVFWFISSLLDTLRFALMQSSVFPCVFIRVDTLWCVSLHTDQCFRTFRYVSMRLGAFIRTLNNVLGAFRYDLLHFVTFWYTAMRLDETWWVCHAFSYASMHSVGFHRKLNNILWTCRYALMSFDAPWPILIDYYLLRAWSSWLHLLHHVLCVPCEWWCRRHRLRMLALLMHFLHHVLCVLCETIQWPWIMARSSARMKRHSFSLAFIFNPVT